MEIIPRQDYVNQVLAFVDTPLIKVLTGIRRSGKSTVLHLVAQTLRERGVPESRIHHLDFDQMAHSDLRDPKALYHYLLERLAPAERSYLFLDEIQEVDGWERVINSLNTLGTCDIYITGSNSHLLSSELATYIAGRYVSFEISPLSFEEHLRFVAAKTGQQTDINQEFSRYLLLGGFPGIHSADFSDDQVYRIINDIYASALIRDVLTRRSIRNTDMLSRIAAYTFESTGSLFSALSISRYFKSQQRKVDADTVLSYLGALSEAFIINKVPRYDLQGKQLLTINEKYYAGDHGLINAVLGPSDRALPGLLENIVWAELRRRSYEVNVGILGKAEIDFVGTRGSERIYVQVTATLAGSESTKHREVAPLEDLGDSYPKYVLSLDPLALPLKGGIKHLRIPDFLLDKSW